MTQNTHYAEQSVVTDPGALADRIKGAGSDLAALYSAEPRLRVAQVVLSINPLDGALREVGVEAVAH